ncbi:MAG: hypothetical protein H6985_08755 [Pseudomonadales bacterium]|nr:hypothetical protein [Halioglobus sp.]MCP5129655.1 hypothetical protein [Pseudomonadales bacterium]
MSSPKINNTGNFLEGNLDAIPIEIIEGVSTQDTDFVRQFVGYVATPKGFVISPDSLAGIDELGGAFLAINYSDEHRHGWSGASRHRPHADPC